MRKRGIGQPGRSSWGVRRMRSSTACWTRLPSIALTLAGSLYRHSQPDRGAALLRQPQDER